MTKYVVPLIATEPTCGEDVVSLNVNIKNGPFLSFCMHFESLSNPLYVTDVSYCAHLRCFCLVYLCKNLNITHFYLFKPFIDTAALILNGDTVGTGGFYSVCFSVLYMVFSIHQHRCSVWTNLSSALIIYSEIKF